MSELERRFAQWRQRLAESGGYRPEVIDELESHLRDEIQRQLAVGQAEDRAWETALSRLGSPQALAAEFAKVAPAAPEPWLPVRLVTFTGIIAAAFFAGFLATRVADGRLGLLLAGHQGAIVIGYSATFLAGALALCYVATRPFRDLSAGQIRALTRTALVITGVAAALTVLGVVLGAFWASEHLGRYWGWDPKEIAGACVVAWGVAMLLAWRRVKEEVWLLLALVGDVVVILAWFGPFATVLPSGALLVLVLFVFSHLALFAAGFVPAGLLRSKRA